MKTVAFSGTNGGVSFSATGFNRALAEIGENTGNALFQFAMWRQIRNPKYVISRESIPESVHELADILCIPAANQINPSWDLGGWADFVEKCDLPIACIGLGAQAQLGGDPRLQLKVGTVRYLKIVAERAQTIGVRGAFTQQVLEHLGITNTIVTGCPSQTINSRLKGRDIKALIDGFDLIERPRIGYTLGTLEEYARPTEQRLSKMVSALPHKIIIQTGPHFMRFLHDGHADEEAVGFFRWVGSFLRPDLSVHEFMSYLADQALFYSDARTWIDQMRSTDLVVGMRIHGAVAAIQAGRLGVCVAFDSRTEELAYTMGYPYVTHEEIMDDTTLGDIVRLARFSAERFDHVRVKNSDNVRKILADAGCALIHE
ncbi:MAG: polysaccharide pyruvyl transferase family protein [Alphaproteobacteria bacterium HGW-Alphaproteobacteria-14]|nr:MAG: polysaccharide pyruvyl transferase family protein [Alphaproteobacteria bacterium HGW-Alphaproteobacteria-14]